MVGAKHSYVARILRPPLGHAGGLGQNTGILCTGETGNLVPCSSSQVAAILPALPGGGWVPSGQNIQTQAPVSAAAPAPTFTSELVSYLPWFAVGLVVLMVMPSGRGPRASAPYPSYTPRRRGRR